MAALVQALDASWSLSWMDPRGGGAGHANKRGEGSKEETTAGLSKIRPNFEEYEGGNSREFLPVHFLATLGHVGAGGVQMTESNIFFAAFCLLKGFCDAEKQRPNAGFFNPKRR